MSPKELNTMLLNNIPELKNKFNEETIWQDGLETGSFIVFEDVFMPFLEVSVELNNESMIEKCYSFIELLTNIKDEYVQNILFVAILGNISSYVNKDMFVKYLKPNSKKIYFDNYSI